MSVVYTIDFRNLFGQLLEVKGQYRTIDEARVALQSFSDAMCVPIGYQDDRGRSYLEINISKERV